VGCHPNTLARMMRNRREHPASADYWLDRIIDVTTRATEWDADQWGFDPTRWMAAERAEMERRIRSRSGDHPAAT
jgi:hypothetical protein